MKTSPDPALSRKIKVIACGVFERELDTLRQDPEHGFDVVLLDAGLHAAPKELKVRLQAEVDATDRRDYGLISILYGQCGRGTIGLVSREVPLILPRVHDCIALFLGAVGEYWKQFKACPGTFYMTPGWFEKKAHPDAFKIRAIRRGWNPEDDPHFREWSTRYGEENATFIVDFFQSWRKNYRRVALINNGLGDVERYRRHVASLADASGWQFEELRGELDYIGDLVAGKEDDERFLFVPPHHMIVATNDARVFTAVPADPSEEDVYSVQRALAGVALGRFVFEGDGETVRRPRGLGLGIDAGGTFTDAVLLDFDTGRVLAKAKSPTTPQDLAIGVEGALKGLAREKMGGVSLASLSTTLATNAIVEGRGAQVGLLLMPIDERALEQVRTQPVRVVPGKMTITGEELEGVDAESVRRAVEELLALGVEAFAVSGYGSVHNPAHERAVRDVIRAVCNAPVVCGHELSGRLNFIRRAHTAVLNARLIPVIDELLGAVEGVLRRYGVGAPLFIVRGDGTLVETRAARERAIETILSGPAASAIGARFLTGSDDLIAVDIGGTTTDVAILTGGRVEVCPEGATVGPWQTSVSAADIMTTGLGGDSYVRVLDGGRKISVGPERVTPLSFLATQTDKVVRELSSLCETARFESLAPGAIEFFSLVRMRPSLQVSDAEKAIVRLLGQGPASRRELAEATGATAPELVPTSRLEELGVIRRAAFTPTDALHVLGLFTGFDGAAARRAAELLARFAGRTAEDFAQRVRDEVHRRAAYEIVRRELSVRHGDPDQNPHPMVSALIGEMIGAGDGRDGPYAIAFREHREVVGIGAPSGAFLPEAGRRLGARVTIPEHSEVANAVGAVTGNVVIRERVSIRPDETGTYIMMSPLGRRQFGLLSEARDEAAQHLVSFLRAKAAEYGTDEREVVVNVSDKTGLLLDGSRQFLELLVEGTLEGPPRAAV